MQWYPDRIPDSLSSLTRNLIWHKDRSEKTVYLTFDDGPTPGVTDAVLDHLAKFDFKVTFFCIGDCVQRHPTIMQKIKEKGHSVGNHTYHHLNAWKCRSTNYLDNVKKADQLIQSNLFRPPYGKITPSLSRKLKKANYQTIMWDVLSGDFDQKRTVESCLKNIIKNTRNGSIVVFHDSLKAENKLMKILPDYLQYLKKNGFQCKAL